MQSQKKIKIALGIKVLKELNKLQEIELEENGKRHQTSRDVINLPIAEDPMTEKPLAESSKLVINNPRSLHQLEIPEIDFEYVDIKEESDNIIKIGHETPLEPSTSIASTINDTMPFIEIKIEEGHDSPPPSPVPPALKRKFVEYSKPITPGECCIRQESKRQMLDQACQTDEVVSNDVSPDDSELVARLRRQNERLRERLAENKIQQTFGKITMESLKGQVKKVRYLTGFPNFISLEIVYKDVENHISFGGKLSKFDIFFMTWMKLKLDLSLNYLSILMDMNITTLTRLFYETFDLLYTKLNEYVEWPDGIENREYTPDIYKHVFDDRNFIIVDCFDIFPEGIGKINNPTPLQNTAGQEGLAQVSKPQPRSKRYLICLSTANSIIYLSKSFDLEVSKHDIAKQSGFLDKIKTEDIILADREFVSKSIYKQKRKCKDVVPMIKDVDGELVDVAFSMNHEYIKIKEHVVKKILLVKQRIMSLTKRPPLLAVTNKYGEEMYSDFVMKTACAIVNLTPPHKYDVSTEEKEDIDI